MTWMSWTCDVEGIKERVFKRETLTRSGSHQKMRWLCLQLFDTMRVMMTTMTTLLLMVMTVHLVIGTLTHNSQHSTNSRNFLLLILLLLLLPTIQLFNSCTSWNSFSFFLPQWIEIQLQFRERVVDDLMVMMIWTEFNGWLNISPIPGDDWRRDRLTRCVCRYRETPRDVCE